MPGLSADMGLKNFAVIGDKESFLKIRNPRWIRVHERRLRRFQKALSRKQYDCKTHTGSKNWYKAKKKVAKERRKTANQRKDFQHKLSRCIADSCKIFVCEDLNIKGMMKNRHLSKTVASVGWYGFFQKVKYKLERTGGPGSCRSPAGSRATRPAATAGIRTQMSGTSPSGNGTARNAAATMTVTATRSR